MNGNAGLKAGSTSKYLNQELKVIIVANENFSGIEAKLWAALPFFSNLESGIGNVLTGAPASEAKRAELEKQKAEGADPEDPDEYRAAGIFRSPKFISRLAEPQNLQSA